MKVLLIDADSSIPNLALMKLSAYHKSIGDTVELKRLGLSYYPSKHKNIEIDTLGYDKVHCSIIFDTNKYAVNGQNIDYGGTGVDLKKALPDEIENMLPDYSIYPDNDTSYGFITRGCIRKCSFCKVPEKEGDLHVVSSIDDIIRHKKVKFMDNNILAYSEHLSVLKELQERHIRYQFNQGLDARLLTEDAAQLLMSSNYLGEFIFAFDSVAYKPAVDKVFELMQPISEWKLKFFVYVHPDMPIHETIYRMEYLKAHKSLPYVMRDIVCFSSPLSEFYTDLAAYSNQVAFFKKLSFYEFLDKRHLDRYRVEYHSKLYNDNM